MKAKFSPIATGYPDYTVIYTEPVQPVNEGWFPEPVIGRLCFIRLLWLNQCLLAQCLMYEN